MHRHLAIIVTLAVLSQPASLPVLAPLGFLEATAQETRQKKEKPKGRRSQVLSKRAYAKIEEAQQLLADEDYANALVQLQQIRDGAKFTPYEKAVALQTAGFAYAGQGDYVKTIAAFEEAANSGDLPPRVVSDLVYNLAQLNLAEGRNARALDYMTRWFAEVEGQNILGSSCVHTDDVFI